jgi:hypothetical protein
LGSEGARNDVARGQGKGKGNSEREREREREHADTKNGEARIDA